MTWLDYMNHLSKVYCISDQWRPHCHIRVRYDRSTDSKRKTVHISFTNCRWKVTKMSVILFRSQGRRKTIISGHE